MVRSQFIRFLFNICQWSRGRRNCGYCRMNSRRASPVMLEAQFELSTIHNRGICNDRSPQPLLRQRFERDDNDERSKLCVSSRGVFVGFRAPFSKLCQRIAVCIDLWCTRIIL
uniref:Uncharacterized protein n=1 Tax=Physcomitrium patens TaxID=3218 RepID=A0A2K1INA8_PHYPA|nr:hypothetical protein PHYPA_027081 [Physcomitrium patens]